MNRFIKIIAVMICTIFIIPLAGCSSDHDEDQQSQTTEPQIQMSNGDLQEETPNLSQLPTFLQQVDPQIVRVYQLAAKYPDVIQHMPCYCGCGQSVGHKSNQMCFMKEIKEDGKVVWDSHAITCYNCQQIAVESIALKEQGKSLKEIRHFIDEKYKEGYAEPTPTPMP
ncbi:uncharacterized protein with PCYCGC motif [Hazenella coriacea]|uniref:Uncharacterized protein with PCYCGC motif n=1 Tax=Hazenella coriacea TaxID=1179467 RepID=A0A4R3LB91_9BACL|nr:PCYCGC domain-containing protein [Hazenella coriacea]TCS96470.1 uncharacterized protein with PCYCGC motif [Hazenella coriacea]